MSVFEKISAGQARLLILALAIAAAAVAVLTIADTSSSAKAVSRLHVSGNRILDQDGRRVLFQGVNRSGTEYACVRGWAIFDGPNTASSVQAIASGHVSIVRVLLNEDCWLGINGISRSTRGRITGTRSSTMSDCCTAMGCTPRCRSTRPRQAWTATYQPAAPDEDHAPALWASVASAFRNDPNVILAP